MNLTNILKVSGEIELGESDLKDMAAHCLMFRAVNCTFGLEFYDTYQFSTIIGFINVPSYPIITVV